MKKVCLLLTGLLFFWGLQAQEIIFEELEEVVQNDLISEELEFQDPQTEDIEDINNEVGYYKGSKRTESTDTIIYYQWDRGLQDWLPVHRVVKTYNGEEQVISRLLQHFTRQGEWVNGDLKHYIYRQGFLTSVVIQVWHRQNQTWHDYFRKSFTYNDSGKLTQIIHQKWFRPEQGWSNLYRKVLVYGDNGNLASDTVYHSRAVSQRWMYAFSDEFFYNDLGFRTERLTRRFHPDYNAWFNLHRALFTPDQNGLVQDIIVQHWHRDLQSWVNRKQVVFTYNDAGLVGERLIRGWHRDTIWVNHHRSLFTYDAGQNLDVMISQDWRHDAGIWANKERNDFEYDDSGTLLSRLTQRWNHENATWVNFRLMQLVIDLKHLVAGTGEGTGMQDAEIVITFPNPYNGNYPVTITGENDKQYTLSVMDINGREVYNRQVVSGQAFRIESNLVPGLYIMSVRDGSSLIESAKILFSR